MPEVQETPPTPQPTSIPLADVTPREAEPDPQPEIVPPPVAEFPAFSSEAERAEAGPDIEPPAITPAATYDQSPYVAAGSEPTPAQSPLAPSPARSRLSGSDWESLIGVKLFSWVAGVAVALAAVLLLRYSIEHGWLQPPVQMAIGLLSGLLLIALCEMKIANDFRATANALDGAGIAILYATLFAAHSVWHLTSGFVSFLLMASVTALAVYLAIRRDSVFIAILGLLGGFATPALLSTGEDRPIALFGYLLIVNLGIAWVAYRKGWAVLTAASLVFTTIYQWLWVGRFLTENKLPMAAAIFLVFPAAALIVLSLARRDTASSKDGAFERTATFGAALPILFGIYATTVPAYGAGFRVLFGFLFVVAVGLAVLAAARGPASLHLLGGVSTVLAFILWLANSYTSDAWPLIVLITIAFVAVYLFAEPLARLAGVPIGGVGKRAIYAAPLLILVFPTLAMIEPRAAGGILLLSAMLIVLAAVAVVSVRSAHDGPFIVGSLLVIVTLAIWSSKHLNPESLAVALLFYTLSFVLITGVGAVQSRRLRAPGLIAWLGLGGFAFLIGVAGETSLSVPPWPLFIALAVMVAAWLAAALLSPAGAVFGAALVAAQLVAVIWLTTAQTYPWPTIGLFVSLAVAASGLAGVLISGRRTAREAAVESGTETVAGRETESLAGALAAALFGAQVVLFDVAFLTGKPSSFILGGAHLLVILAFLWIAASRGWHRLATAAAITSGVCLIAIPELPSFPGRLLLTLLFLIPFMMFPIVLRGRLARHFQPHLAAVVMSAFVFFDLWRAIDTRGWNDFAGLLPLALATAFGLLLMHLLRHEGSGERERSRLALVASAILAYVSVAVPLQLDREWVTVSWALLAAALAWLYTRIPHRGLIVWAAGLGAVVFVRLAANPAVFAYHPRGHAPILNWYLYAYGVPALAFFTAGWLLMRKRDVLGFWGRRVPSLFSAGGVILLFLLLNVEIADFYSRGESLTFDFSATLAQDLTYTLGWAIFAILLLIAGIVIENRPVRVAALALLVVAILKCFLHDLARLGGLYRVGSLLGLAISLAIVAVLLQRFIFRKAEI